MLCKLSKLRISYCVKLHNCVFLFISCMYVGQTSFQMWGTTVGMEWIPGTWVVEYGRGIPIPSMIFVTVDTLTGTADVYNLFKISSMWGKAILRSLLNFKL